MSWSYPDGDKSPEHQLASFVWPTLFRSSGAQVSLQEECVFIFLSQTCVNYLNSDCSMTSNKFEKPKSAFKLQSEDNILKELYIKAKANLQKFCENMFFTSQASHFPLMGAEEEGSK